jgi:hypothetical protein
VNSVKIRLPEIVVPGRRLGRHVAHDIRSAAFLTAEVATPPADVLHEERIGILDQGQIGSCTGNAVTGMLGTTPFFDALPKGTKLDEAFAVQRYSRATQVDPFPGTYKPTDTGSDGNSVCKAARDDGYLSGWTHATSLAACYAFIPTTAAILGTNWYEGMDEPDVHGNVELSGQNRGGHEVCIVGRTSSRWVVRNSWGETWGDSGHFYLTDAQLTQILGEQGDVTVGAPLDVPPPAPQPAGTTVTFTADQRTALNDWAAAPHLWRKATAAAKAWKGAVGA